MPSKTVIYSVKFVSGYDAWGGYSTGSTIRNFTSYEKAKEFCEKNFKSFMDSSWPGIVIHKEEVEE